jgi:hypothetical protein
MRPSAMFRSPISSSTQASGNDMNVSVNDGLAGGFSVIEADVEAIDQDSRLPAENPP